MSRLLRTAMISAVALFGDDVCANSYTHAAWSVDLDPYADPDIHHITMAATC